MGQRCGVWDNIYYSCQNEHDLPEFISGRSGYFQSYDFLGSNKKSSVMNAQMFGIKMQVFELAKYSYVS